MNLPCWISIIVIITSKAYATTDLEDYLNETAEIHLTGDKSCSGPGSDPYRNLVFTGRCNCKKNVGGTFCEECKKNSFDLSPIHPHGCLRCFCSGLSTICRSSNYFIDKLSLEIKNDSPGVELVYKNLSTPQRPLVVNLDQNEVFVSDIPAEFPESYYWKLPEEFIGDRLTSYGGYLNFTIDYKIHQIPKEQRQWLKDPLAVIRGNGITLYYHFRKRFRRIASHFLPIVEQSWYKFADHPDKPLRVKKSEDRETKKAKTRRRRRAKRKDIMVVLSNVSYILLKANYRANVEKVSLLHVSMTQAVSNATTTTELATSVEQCECPKGYGGLSCQHCSSGFTKNSGNHLSTKKKRSANECSPCECNGHADSCHHDNGKCMDCKHNTIGDYCQHSLLQCDVRGTWKHEILPNVPSKCLCKARAQGELCDTCKLGFFNLDTENEMGCKKCWCNGVTFKCKSSELKRFQIRIQPPAFINVGFYEKGGRQNSWATQVNDGRAVFHFKKYMRRFSNIFWSLPKIFTGNLLKSYGGSFNFTIYHNGLCDNKISLFPFVEIESFRGEILTWKFSPAVILNSFVKFTVQVVEDQFEFYGQKAERSIFLQVISAVKSVKVYIPYCEGLRSTEIKSIALDTSVNFVSEADISSEVEECDCPVEYSGLSCENCSPGYVKDSFGKKCIRKTTFS